MQRIWPIWQNWRKTMEMLDFDFFLQICEYYTCIENSVKPQYCLIFNEKNNGIFFQVKNSIFSG